MRQDSVSRARHLLRSVAWGVALFVAAGAARADEGQWPPDQLDDISAKFSALGIRLAPKQLWNDDSGLARAAVNLSGCSASFVSAEGLIATNHHCAYRAIQSQSTAERDLLSDGFIAKERSAEIDAKGYTVRVLRRITDVTEQVRQKSRGQKDDLSRYREIIKVKKALVAECEKAAVGARCEVESFFLGASYKLFETIELRDIRLVYAPPKSIGEYGGEIDNWMWPRHTGDFTLLRAYVDKAGKPAEPSKDNVPYAPKSFLKVSAEGIAPGDPVVVMGYPRQTNRHLPAAEVSRQVEQVLPATISLYGEWLEILNDHEKGSKAVAIKVAALQKSLANRHKNAQGMLAGIAAMELTQRRNKEHARLEEHAKGKPEQAKALATLTELASERRAAHDRELLLSAVARGTNLTALAVDLARLAEERTKPDAERSPGFQDRDLASLWQSQERRLRDFDPNVEAEMLASLVARARALGESQAIVAFRKIAGQSSERQAIAKALVSRYRSSRLSDPGVAKTLFDGKPEALQKFRDPVLDLGRELARELVTLQDVGYAREGKLSRTGPKFFEVLEAVRGGAIYPDANGTIRISIAKVQGYLPRDGLIATPQTSLSGAVAKHTGRWPFDLPQAVRDKAPIGKNSYWADPGLADVPVCFLSNADTTGGNSGSPVLDSRGQLVALNFDRVWENIAGDFGYTTERSRNIAVDIRYMLWLLDRVEDAGLLLRELGVGRYRDAPARRPRAETAHRPKPTENSGPAPKQGSCALRAGRPQSSWAWIALLGLALRSKRRTTHSRLKA